MIQPQSTTFPPPREESMYLERLSRHFLRIWAREGLKRLRHSKSVNCCFLVWCLPAPPMRLLQMAKVKGAKKEKKAGPKRALSAFFVFAASKRTEIKEANPDFSVTDISKELGRQWREMAAEDKAPFEEIANKDKARYTREKAAFDAKAAAADE